MSSLIITLPSSLIEKWAKELSVDEKRLCGVICKHDEDSFCFAVNGAVTTTTANTTTSNGITPIKKTTKTVARGVHTCERVPRGKEQKCGKNAKNFITGSDGEKTWFCGSEKSGCYKAALGAAQKATTAPAKKVTKTSTVAKEQTLLDKIVEKGKFTISKVQVDGKILHINSDNGILFNPDTVKAYGVLNDKNKISPLGEKERRWLKTNSIEEEKVEIVEEDTETQQSEEDEIIEGDGDEEEDVEVIDDEEAEED